MATREAGQDVGLGGDRPTGVAVGTGRRGHEDRAGSRRNGIEDGGVKRVARGLGWFSIGLGLAEVVAPKRLAGFLGMEDRTGLIRAYGLREIVTGVGILAQRRPAPWLWARVGGDLLDLSTLGASLAANDRRRGRIAAATGTVAAVTALDIACARKISREGDVDGGNGSTMEVERSITVEKSADQLYRLWREPQTLTQVMGHVGEVSATSEGRSRWVARAPLGRRLEWETRVVEDRPGEILRWESLPGATVRNEGSVRFRPAEGDRGTVVTLRIRFDPPGGRLGDAAAHLLGVVPRTLVGTALRRFKSLAETGEIPTTEHNPSTRAK